jgi:RimJ/RimL family protein N-acetyltransferase
MMRLYYEAPIKSKPWDSSIPKGFTLERLTKELLEKKLKKMDRVRAEMNSERNTIKEFLEKSFGYVAITNGEVACWCMSEYDSEDSFEVGIETVEKYRRRGLATATATALIQYAASIGLRRVGWHCWKNNKASVKTVESLGLSQIEEYPVCLASFR